MSIPYSWKIATNKPTAFLRLLIRWEGTIYKYILLDFCMFLLVYGLISVTYRHLMSDQSRRYFEYYCLYCTRYGHLIPVGLVLGFFVDVVVKRWWGQFQDIPWPDEAAMMLSAYVLDDSPSTKQKMKTFMRYINLANIITLRLFCSRIKKRYPVDQILIADGLMTSNELKRLQNSAPKRKAAFYAAPLFWACDLVLDMRASGLIMSDRAVELLYKNIAVIRAKGAMLVIYNMIVNVPLGFTQVATMTIYVYVIASTFSWQFLDVTQRYNRRLVDLYIPIFGILRLIFFLGWIKVAEALINPFGEDPDDFAMDGYNERDVQISNFIIDQLHGEAPPLSNGVILTNIAPLKAKAPVEDLESGTTSPTGLLARKSISLEGANLFMGSCAQMSIDPKESTRIRRRTVSYFDPSIVRVPMRWLFGSGDINPLQHNIIVTEKNK